MEIIRGLTNLREPHRGSVLTIGTFDGIHLGHQVLIARLVRHAAGLGRPAALLTFEPMPREHLMPRDPPPRLTSLRERWRVLECTGLDYLWLLRFDETLRNLSGEAFAGLLSSELRTPAVIVGHDFRFGRHGEATVPLLEGAGARLGFTVDVVPPVTLDGQRVSSSGVRDALARGEFDLARQWLGRPYVMCGRVVRGNQLGRTLGFPTANLRLERRRAPLKGIFAVRVHGVSPEAGPAAARLYAAAAVHPPEARIPPRPAGAGPVARLARAGLAGVASLGTRPTVNGVETLLEAHVFDFSGDLYGREIGVEFVARLRDEQRFENLDALTVQMNEDARIARRILQC